LVVEAQRRGLPLDAANERTLENIDRSGWAVTMVAPRPSETFPPFAYTIGLSQLGSPELVLVDIAPNTAAAILNDIGERVRNGGSIEAGALRDVLKGDHVLDLRPVEPIHYETYLGRLLWFHKEFGAEPLRVLQVVWPDKAGRYPDDAHSSPEERKRAAELQPLLTRTPR